MNKTLSLLALLLASACTAPTVVLQLDPSLDTATREAVVQAAAEWQLAGASVMLTERDVGRSVRMVEGFPDRQREELLGVADETGIRLHRRVKAHHKLTVALHELGHVLGANHARAGLMLPDVDEAHPADCIDVATADALGLTETCSVHMVSP